MVPGCLIDPSSLFSIPGKSFRVNTLSSKNRK